MDHTEILLDILNSCRLCLKNNLNIRSIFSKDSSEFVEEDISQQIYECTNLKVTKTDGATGICKTCLGELLSIIRFRTKCYENDKYLRTKYQGIYFSSENSVEISTNPNISFIDLGDEKTILNGSTELIDFLDEVKFDDDEMIPEGGTTEIKEFIFDEDNCDESSSNSTDDDSEPTKFKKSIKKNKSLTDALGSKVEIRYILKNRPKTGLFDEPFPKLKKKDLIEPKAYQGLCHLCGKHFQHLWVHLQSHSSIPTETCDICGKGFKSKANLHLHVLTHTDAQIPCEICGKKYRTKMRLKRHMRVHTGERPFECSICQKKFYTKYNLDVHNRTHTGEKPFQCDYCKECFTHSYAIKHHTERLHPAHLMKN